MIQLYVWGWGCGGDQAGRGPGRIAVISLGVFHKFCSDAFLFDSSRGSDREFKQLPWEMGYSLHRTCMLKSQSGLSSCLMGFSGEKLVLEASPSAP